MYLSNDMYMKTILLTTDFSKNAKNAIAYAIRLFGKVDVNYLLINTYVEPRSSTNVVVSLNDFLKKESLEGVKEAHEELNDLFGPDLSMEHRTYYGDLAPVILALSKEESLDYVVVGTKGASALENFIMGSNTLDVVKNVKVPILVVPQDEELTSLDRIALAADYEHIDHIHLLDPLTFIARRTKAKLKIVNINTEEKDTDYDHALEAFELHNILEGITHQFYTEKNDDVVEGIDRFVKDKNVQLLAMVARKHTFFDRLFHKSITKEVSKLADVPLLILHEV